MTLPWVPSAIRALLLSDTAFAALVPEDRLCYRSPPNVTTPWATIQAPGGFSLSGDGVAWSPLVQIDGWAPNVGNPHETAWQIAAEAARVLGRARNITFGSMSYSARLTDGPLSDLDVTRGTANPIYRAIVRAELIVHTT